MGEIKSQGIRNAVLTYIGIFIGFLNLLVIQPRFLSPEEVGLTRVLFSFSTLIATFIPLGIGNITTRFFPAFRDESKSHNGFLGFALLFPILGFIVCGGVLYLFRDYFVSEYSKESPLFAEYFNYVFPLSFILGLITVFNTYCFSLFKTTFPTLLNDIVSRIGLIFIFSLYFIRLITIDQLIVLFVSIYGFQLIMLLLYVLRVDRPSIKVNRIFLREQKPSEMVSYGLLLTLASFSSLALKYLDSVLLVGFDIPLAIVGIYSVCAFIPTIIEAPVGALEKISNAKISEAFKRNDINEIGKIYSLSVRYFIVIGGVLAVLILINIYDLFTFLPADYAIGIPVVIIISLGAFINMATGVNNAVIFYSSNYKVGTYLLYLLVIIAVILNSILIPQIGFIGAAWATAISSLLYNFLKFVYIHKKYRLQPYTKENLLFVLVFLTFLIAGAVVTLPFKPVVNILIRSFVFVLVMFFLLKSQGLLKSLPDVFRKKKAASDKGSLKM